MVAVLGQLPSAGSVRLGPRSIPAPLQLRSGTLQQVHTWRATKPVLRYRSTPICSSSPDIQGTAARFGRSAARGLKQTFEQIEDNSRRAARQLNRQFHISEKAQKAASGTQAAVGDGAEWLDRTFKVKRRVRLLAESVQRDGPKWRKQLQEFSGTTAGQVVWGLVLAYMLYSGLLFALLRIFFLVSWLAPVLLLVFARQIGSQAAAQAEQQRRAQQAAQQMSSNPFSRFGTRSPFGRRQSPQQGPDISYSSQQGGPIIDADFSVHSLDDEDL